MRGRGANITSINLALTGAILVVASLFILSPAKVSASGDHLVINEIYPNTKDSSEQEWVELYIPNNSIADFSGLYFEKASGSIKPADCDDFSNGYYVCYFGNIGYSWLSNTGDTIKLKDSSGIIDQATFPDFTSYKGKSISRIPNGQDTDNDFKIVPITKGYRNYEPPPIIYSDKIIINEILPQPATLSDDEFIELYNTGADEVDISGWRLNDASAGSGYPIPSGTMISGGEYLVFCKNSTSIFCKFNYKTIALNDTSTDSALLIDPNGDIKSTVSYTKTIRGQSYSLFASGWLWTEELTPGSKNILKISLAVTEEDGIVPSTDIKTARQKEDGETVAVTGTVSVVPGVLSTQYFYIQDDSSGIQIYNYNKLFPILKAGDAISVIGELTSISNERRIKTLSESDIIIIRQNSPPTPKMLRINQIGEEYEGELIQVTGDVSATSGSTFYLQESDQIQVVIRASAGIIKPKMKRGNIVQITGILSQYQDYYRLLPISQDGVKILTSGVLPDTGSDSVNNTRINELWTLRPSQPARRKRLVTNSERD